MNKLKIILLVLIFILLSTISFIVMFKTYKYTKIETNNETNNETSSEIIINNNSDISENKELSNKLENELNSENYLSDRFTLLSKYSEKYVSVAEWMISEIIKEWDTNGFTVIIGDEENGYQEVDGLTVYKDASEYMTYLLNSNADIEEYFFMYCEDKYTELRYTYLLGKEENKEYEKTSSEILYKELLNYYQDKEFQKIIDKVEELIVNYKFTMPENYNICHIYQDAKLSLDYGNDMDAINYGLNYMNSTETYFINFMRLTDKRKIYLINDTNSLIPMKETSIKIDNICEINLDEYSWIKNQYYDLIRNSKSVTEIKYKEYNLDKQNYYSCIAYIVNNFDRTKQILTIKWDDDSDCYLHTAKEYNDIYNNITESENTGTDGYWNTTTNKDINNNENIQE